MDLRGYARAFDEVERDFEATVEGFGVPFEDVESQDRVERERTAARCGCRCENGATSLVHAWLSPACVACRTGECTATFFVDLRCTRDCYFCFNPNQEHYEYFLAHTRDVASELAEAHAHGAAFDCLAVTGGEPLLHLDAVLAFLNRARELYPDAHTRLYTNGDLADEPTLAALAEAGLAEMRLSVKPEDVAEGGGQMIACLERAVAAIPDVVIEMPVIPGTVEDMKRLMARADAVGVRGMNLLEFDFPLYNADEYVRRGFRLRRRPYRHLYNYWYGGGLPVAGSESEALELMEFACEQGFRMGVHYCSADNRNTGQIYQQNLAFDAPDAAGAALRERYPWMAHDEDTRFLVCAKAFGRDVGPMAAWAREAGVPHGVDEGIPLVAFPLEQADTARAAVPGAEIGVSVNVVEDDGEGNLSMREVAIE